MTTHIAVTPARVLDPGIAIAACRAGGIGILDLGCGDDTQEIRAAVDRMARGAGACAQWGVRWDALGSTSRGLERLQEVMPQRAPILILAGLRPDDLVFSGLNLKQRAGLRKQLRRIARRIFVEVGDLRAALAAEAAGCDGLVVKGHEAGGWASRHSSFILLQELRGRMRVPYWIQGGIGMHSAPAAVLAGAEGVVLSEQLWLAEESPYAGSDKARAWAQLDGSETVLVGTEQRAFRLFARSGRNRLQVLEQAVIKDEPWQDLLREALQETDDPLIPMGEEIAFAAGLARRHVTVGRIIAALNERIVTALDEARAQKALGPDSPLARVHGTRYPIVQGPMTRVSDVAPFAKAVADGGGLPMVALSVMRKEQVETLLREAKALLGERAWGVGVLGFLPLEARQEQLAIVREVKPPFAVIAGGRPSQARELEALGIATYLHVPSPGLLQGFLKDGARKFIFEGGECGGHTGPLTSFVLWEQAVETLAAADIPDPEAVQVLFAGGIHDALSAAMVSTIAAPLVARGMKAGVVMGTAYLFTREIVGTGAVLDEFQAQAIACEETTLLQSGKGMYTRCAVTPFCDEFNRTRRDLLLALEAPEKVLKVLEMLNIGRLRIASKGIAHNSERKADNAQRYVPIPPEAQRREGMYMLGEVARLRHEVVSVAELHETVSAGSTVVLEEAAPRRRPTRRNPAESDIAIVGMACLLPGAQEVRRYWENILRRIDMVREVSDERWRIEDYFDPRRGTPDKVYSKWGAFLDDVPFDTSLYGIPPAALRSIEPVQLLALECARRAIADAGLDRRPFPRERTATIFAAGGNNDLGCIMIFRSLLPHYLPRVPDLPEETRRRIIDTLYAQELPKWTEDSFPGMIGNVIAGRVANRMDLRGTNFTVDAACGSSLAALDAGIRQLRSGDADVALVGAVDGTNNATSFMCFAQTHALSPRGRSRPFDDSADGIALGEGIATLVLKRLGDAERDGDRIHAVIKGIGSSSDGRNRSLTAPHPQGQVMALRRAYQDAEVDPATIGLIEAHGTGTAVGDKSEIESLTVAFGEVDMPRQSCAVGSVKSMIGHTKVAAGLAGVIKATLAMEHRVLPPTLNVEKPNSQVDFATTPFYISAEARPWLAPAKGHPRRSGVSAFGFGGTNFHVVLEEYTGAYRPGDTVNLNPRDAELFAFHAHDRGQLLREVEGLVAALEHPEHLDLAQLAASLHAVHRRQPADNGARTCRLALLAGSPADLAQKLAIAARLLRGKETELRHPQGVYYREGPAMPGGVCFLFPGQGSQRINMLGDLITGLPELQTLHERADALLAEALPRPLSRYVHPLPVFSDEERARQQAELNDTHVAQPALGVIEAAALRLLATYGLAPDFVAGHSFGEYAALHAAGVIGFDDFIRLAELRGRLAAEAGRRSPGAMAAVDADELRLAGLIERHGLAVSLANLNAADQTIIAGPPQAIDVAAVLLTGEGLRVTKLAVSAAFHSPAMASARDQLAEALAKVELRPARVPVWSNTTADAYPDEVEAMRALLVRHMTEPVRFAQQIEGLHAAGARVFVEVGPGLVMSGLVDRILGDRPHATLALDAPGRAGWLQLAHCLAQAHALGVPVDIGRWFEGRGLEAVAVEEVFARARAKAAPGPLTWRVNGARAKPWAEPPAEARKKIVPIPATRPAAATPRAPDAAPHGPAAAPPAPEAVPPGLLVTHQPASPDHKQRIKPHGSITMKSEDKLRLAESPEDDLRVLSPAAQVHHILGQFIALQRDQHATLRHLLEFEGHLVAGTLDEFVPAPAQPALPRMPTLQPQASRPFLQAVPPAPVLPAQVLAVHAGATAPAPAAGPAPAPAPAPAPVAAEPAEATPAPPAAPDDTVGRASTATFKANLLHAVSERTGYPEDMLDINAHMEADLGIDSIKRIEILSQLKEHHDLMEGRDEESVFEELSGLKTLGEIIDWYDRQHEASPLPQGGPPTKKSQTPLSASPAETVESHTEVQPDPVHAYTLCAIPAPAQHPARGALPTGGLPIVLVGPLSAVSNALAAALVREGCRVRQIIPGRKTRALGEDRYELDPASPDAASALKRLLGNSGLAAGTVFSLLALASDGPEAEPPPGAAKALFLVCKVLEEDLRQAAESGAGRLINVTALDGRFGLGGTRSFPWTGAGTLGVAKTVAREWGELRVSCLDFAPEIEPADVVGHILDEWCAADPALEIGHTLDGRWHLALEPQRPAPAPRPEPLLGAESVVLLTGGAVGITSRIAQALAKRYRPRLVLVGRSPLPEEEAEDTRELTDPAQLKRVLIARLKAERAGNVKPAEVDRVFKRLLKDREMRANLDALRAVGAEVEYHSLDVRDAEAFAALIDDVYARMGRIDGVLHGAGIIEDKLIRDKTPESFAAVHDTKVVPAGVLAERLRPDGLKFLAFFSSVAGRFGNAGQSDYSAANELLNKLAGRLGHAWPGVQVVALDWGPWASGMVGKEMLRFYAERGIEPIRPESGTRHFLEQLARGACGEPEVVITASLDQIAAMVAPRRRRAEAARPRSAAAAAETTPATVS